MSRSRIYLDHAATSWPKPAVVLDAMQHYAQHCGAAAGRGSYRSAITAASIVRAVRRQIARIIKCPAPDCISLHSSGTGALNAAIRGWVRPGDHVVTTAAEHNSVLRPLRFLERSENVTMTIVPCDSAGRVAGDRVLEAVTAKTRLVALTGASNVTGAVGPVEEVAEHLRSLKPQLLVDAAQTFGYRPIDVVGSAIDFLAAPGHKGGSGPLGTGFLYVNPDLHHELQPTILGGTGSQSESLEMPTAFPDKLEAGNLNVPALAGWEAGLRAWDEANATNRCRELVGRMFSTLSDVATITQGPEDAWVPIVSLVPPALAAGDLSSILDAEFGIETRAGFHCAALIHQFIDSETSGTLRVSAGLTTTDDEIAAVGAALQSVLARMGSQ